MTRAEIAPGGAKWLPAILAGGAPARPSAGYRPSSGPKQSGRRAGDALGLALILGIDRFRSGARALTNIAGNGVVTIVVTRGDDQLDRGQPRSIGSSTVTHPLAPSGL